tara:strand:- start:198 stop:992 length:795 start_codon:yes stop_codon:yes gene_type:complete
LKISKIFFIFLFFLQNSFARDYLILQSTTSTANTGLLEKLSESFFQESGIEIRSVAVGTGMAIENAKKGNADLLIVHSKIDEIKFIEDGFGSQRFDIMYNDFVIVGPINDPAKIADKQSIKEVMKILHKKNNKFISRDDNSGTHKKEMSLWESSDLSIPDDSSYVKTGSGMANTLNIAAEMYSYVLTDRGTWLSFKNKKNLKILFDKDPSLHNPYGLVLMNNKKFSHVEYAKSLNFANWLLHGNGKKIINNYKINGQQIFFTYD